jgi:metallophosphoesterase superfamily enzyme
MGKQDKRELRIRQNPKNVSLEDFETLIKRYGEIIEGHSHPKAHIGNHVYSYKRENPIKGCYVDLILRFIDEVKRE